VIHHDRSRATRLPRRVRLLRLLAAAALWLVNASTTQAASPEVRGTWLTTTANDAIASPTQTAETMRRLRAIGLNSVYVETWKNGYTQFPSDVLERTIGVRLKPAGAAFDPADGDALRAAEGRDLLQETLIEAHRQQLTYIAWFEYGFMAAYRDTDNHLRRQHGDWLMTTRDGDLVSEQNPFLWMNPLRPEARQLLLGIVLEAVERYDLDGVQLDDRIAWPVSMGYDPYTRQVYRDEHDGAEPPDDPRDPAWIAWRAAKVTDFAGQFYAALKAARPQLIVSISPAVWDWCYDNYACDWREWARRGWMEEFVPQVYRPTAARFAETWPAQLRAIGPRVEQLVAGLSANLSTGDLPWEDLHAKLELVRDGDAAGHCLWYSRAILDTYEGQLTQYYDVARLGTAPDPRRPDGWRPPPVVAERDGGAWYADVPQAGAYRVIAHDGQRWQRLRTESFSRGTTRVEQIPAGTESVELLRDRRGPP
jgi:uncharacterized lipoprotein YddW (UPF0748 family)